MNSLTEKINHAISAICGGNFYDYCSDLNKMHDAENILTPAQLYEMKLILRYDLDNADHWRASAIQRAKAFIWTISLFGTIEQKTQLNQIYLTNTKT